MSELIWVGNALLPRGFVYVTLVFVVLVAVAFFVWLTDGGKNS